MVASRAAVLPLVAVFLAVGVPAHAAAPAFLGTWGSAGSGPGQFSFAHHLAVTASGEVFVGDLLNDRVQHFSATGSILGAFAQSGADGVALASDGTLFVVSGNQIAHVSTSGAFIGGWGATGSGPGQFSAPIDVAVDDSDNVYVSEAGNHRVQKFTSAGTFVTQWGSMGSGDAQFQFPLGLLVTPAGEVLVADVAASQIQRFTRNGAFIQRWGAFGAAPGQLDSPGRPSLDPDGNLLVPEGGANQRVSVFTLDGTFKLAWGGAGAGQGQFNNPTCVGCDATGTIYVMDKDNARVQKFASASTPAVSSSWGRLKRLFGGARRTTH